MRCEDLYEGVYTFTGLYMELFELDWDGDDRVTELEYASVNIPISCENQSGPQDCSGQSAWVSQSDSKVSADIAIQLYMRYWP